MSGRNKRLKRGTDDLSVSVGITESDNDGHGVSLSEPEAHTTTPFPVQVAPDRLPVRSIPQSPLGPPPSWHFTDAEYMRLKAEAASLRMSVGDYVFKSVRDALVDAEKRFRSMDPDEFMEVREKCVTRTIEQKPELFLGEVCKYYLLPLDRRPSISESVFGTARRKPWGNDAAVNE